jgi:UTP--glucose-1-phosphate uridylyltransferase
MAVTKVRKAVFPAAGLGTRFLPATKAMPKEMLPLVDKPLIQYGVEEAVAAGCDEIIFVTGRGKSAMEDHFDRSPDLEAMLVAGEDYLRAAGGGAGAGPRRVASEVAGGQ